MWVGVDVTVGWGRELVKVLLPCVYEEEGAIEDKVSDTIRTYITPLDPPRGNRRK